MNKKILALCDEEEAYLFQLMNFLEKKELPYEIRGYTSPSQLLAFVSENKVEILILAENAYQEAICNENISQIILLREEGNVIGSQEVGRMKVLNKYQAADSLYKEIAQYLLDNISNFPILSKRASGLQIIGIYTPVGRCLQTTFALALGQILAQKHKTLYMNFEAYSGFRHLLHRDFKIDITDLLYYFSCEKEKLAYRLEGMIEKINQLHFIPPVFSHMDLESIEGSSWLALFEQIESSTNYEYLILDLTESMQGLYEILRQCSTVFTIVKEDSWAMAKVAHYEELLRIAHYDDILGKTKMKNLPIFRQLPQKVDMLTHGELATYVKQLIEEDIYEKIG